MAYVVEKFKLIVSLNLTYPLAAQPVYYVKRERSDTQLGNLCNSSIKSISYL